MSAGEEGSHWRIRGGVISLGEDSMGRKRRSYGEMQQDLASSKTKALTDAFVHRPPLNKRAIRHSDKPAISACYKRDNFDVATPSLPTYSMA